MGCFVPTNNIDTSDATATASRILNGYTAYVASGKVTGSYVAPVQTTTELYVLMSSYSGTTVWSNEWAKFINGTCYGNVAPSGVTIVGQYNGGYVSLRNGGSYTWNYRQMGDTYDRTLPPNNSTSSYTWASGLTFWRTY